MPSGSIVGRTYSWEELSVTFGCNPRYFSVGGGMLSRRALGALILITHPGGAGAFNYGDYWDDGDLVYTGKGLVGNQQLAGENWNVAENLRTLFVFTHVGRRMLSFEGVAECVDFWPDIAPDRNGAPCRIYRFRLSFAENPRQITRRHNYGEPQQREPVGLPSAAAGRIPRLFNPERSPSSYRAPVPNQSPEETAALQEKAIRGHHEILVCLYRALQAQQWIEVEEIDNAIDLRARRSSDSTQRVIFEAKTVSSANESHQVRSGLAQLLEYRFLYGEPADDLCLICNTPIADARIRFLRALGIDFGWVSQKRLLSRSPSLSGDLSSLFQTLIQG